MTKNLTAGACALVVLLNLSSAAAWTEEKPEIGSLAPPDSARQYDLDPELEIVGTAWYMLEDDLDAIYGLLGGGGLGFSVQSGRNTRCFIRLQYLRSKGDPYYDLPSFDGGAPATVHVVPFAFGLRHDLATRAALRFNVGASFGFEWIREDLPHPDDPLESLAHTGIGWGWDLTMGPEYRTRDDRRGFGLEFGYGLRRADLGSSGINDHALNREGMFGRAYLALALGAADHEEAAR